MPPGNFSWFNTIPYSCLFVQDVLANRYEEELRAFDTSSLTPKGETEWAESLASLKLDSINKCGLETPGSLTCLEYPRKG